MTALTCSYRTGQFIWVSRFQLQNIIKYTIKYKIVWLILQKPYQFFWLWSLPWRLNEYYPFLRSQAFIPTVLPLLRTTLDFFEGPPFTTISPELENLHLFRKNLIFRKDEMSFAISRSVVAWNRVGGDMGWEEWNTRGTRKLLGVTVVFIVLIVVIVSWMYTHVKTHQNVPLNMSSLLYVNYISIKLFLKSYLLRRIITKVHHPAKKSPVLFFSNENIREYFSCVSSRLTWKQFSIAGCSSFKKVKEIMVESLKQVICPHYRTTLRRACKS